MGFINYQGCIPVDKFRYMLINRDQLFRFITGPVLGTIKREIMPRCQSAA